MSCVGNGTIHEIGDSRFNFGISGTQKVFRVFFIVSGGCRGLVHAEDRGLVNIESVDSRPQIKNTAGSLRSTTGHPDLGVSFPEGPSNLQLQSAAFAVVGQLRE
jgi:hypothetical protein